MNCKFKAHWITIGALAFTAAAYASAPVAEPVKAEPKYILVEEQVLTSILQYLASKPYQETYQLIPALQQSVKPFVKEDVCKPTKATTK